MGQPCRLIQKLAVDGQGLEQLRLAAAEFYLAAAGCMQQQPGQLPWQRTLGYFQSGKKVVHDRYQFQWPRRFGQVKTSSCKNGERCGSVEFFVLEYWDMNRARYGFDKGGWTCDKAPAHWLSSGQNDGVQGLFSISD